MRSRLTLWLIVGVCIAPVVLSYLFYYGIRPDERTNYGELIQPQRDLSQLPVQTLIRPESESGFLDVLRGLEPSDPRAKLDGLDDFRGRWLILRVGPSECSADCQKELWVMRQVRLTTGRDRDRVERLWLVTDNRKPGQAELADYEGTWVLGVASTDLQGAWQPSVVEKGPGPLNPSGSLSPLNPLGPETSFWLVDPLGNLMMRFPKDPDPAKMKKDIIRLLKASRIG